MKLTELLKQLMVCADLPSVMRAQIDKYLAQLEEQIAKEHDIRSALINPPK